MNGGTYNRTLGNLRRASIPLMILVVAAMARPTPVPLAIGAGIAGLGEAIRFWAAGHLLKTKELVTSGPYRYTRNPLYLGRLLILTGFCLMANLPHGGSLALLAVGLAVFFGYYFPRKERVEPARLAGLYGEAFTTYHRSVPALFPSLRPWGGGSARRWSRARMLRNHEHRMVAGMLLVTLYLLWRALESSRQG